jgi:hypothetical protein
MHEMHTVCRTAPGLATVSLRGESGMLHGFTAFPLNEAPCGPAVYIFARPAAGLSSPKEPGWALFGIAESGDIRDNPDQRYSRIVEGLALGATHLLMHFCYREASQRRLIVEDLAGSLNLPYWREPLAPWAA